MKSKLPKCTLVAFSMSQPLIFHCKYFLDMEMMIFYFDIRLERSTCVCVCAHYYFILCLLHSPSLAPSSFLPLLQYLYVPVPCYLQLLYYYYCRFHWKWNLLQTRLDKKLCDSETKPYTTWAFVTFAYDANVSCQWVNALRLQLFEVERGSER